MLPEASSPHWLDLSSCPSRQFPRATCTSAFSTEILLHLPAHAAAKRRSALEPGEVVPPFPIWDNDFMLLPHPRATRGSHNTVLWAGSVQRALVWAREFQET